MGRLNLADWKKDAKAALSKMAFDYYVSGANDEVTVAENKNAFQRIALRYRVLRDVSQRNCGLTLLGDRIQMPILIAPTAFHQLAHAEGEVATARAAGEAGTIMTLSTLSNRAVEKVVASTDAPIWFQLYIYKDRAITSAMLDRVVEAGCKAIVFTVDAPLLGQRESDMRNGFCLPDGFAMENLLPEGYEAMKPRDSGSSLAAYFAELLDPSISWRDLEWLCSRTSLPVFVKGIVHPQDAILAVDAGAAGVIVSNHGGRQLDTAPATIRALPGVVAAVSGRQTLTGGAPLVLLDGGIRRGTDVIKALAFGANAVLMGRPILWGLSVDGRQGVVSVLKLMADELDLAMALCGCRNLGEITDDLIF